MDTPAGMFETNLEQEHLNRINLQNMDSVLLFSKTL